MSDKILIDQYDGVAEYLVFDESADKYHVVYEQDITTQIEANKALYNHTDGYTPSREWKHVAEFPIGVIPHFEARYGANPFLSENRDLLKRVLNDPETRFFRVSPGRV